MKKLSGDTGGTGGRWKANTAKPRPSMDSAELSAEVDGTWPSRSI
jgi:hypothetical protein